MVELKTLQHDLRQTNREMQQPFGSATEVMLAMVEELGEVATEIAILDQIGSKAEWKIGPSKERLAEEITHVLNLILVLANLYDIDLDEKYAIKRQALAYQKRA